MRLDTTHTTNSLHAFSRYRFHFNGKETDNEVYGGGNVYDYGMRIYDSRLGRFLSADPLLKDYPWWSPYHYAGNNPIQMIDIDGLEGAVRELPINTPQLNTQSVEKVLAQARQKALVVHAIVQKLDLPESFKQPYNKDGTPNMDYQMAVKYVSNNITVQQNNSSSVATDALGLAADLQAIDKTVVPFIEKGADNVAAVIVNKTMMNSASASTRFAMVLRIGGAAGKAATGLLGVVVDIITANGVGKGSSVTEQKQAAIAEAFDKFITPPPIVGKENPSDGTIVVTSPPPVID